MRGIQLSLFFLLNITIDATTATASDVFTVTASGIVVAIAFVAVIAVAVKMFVVLPQTETIVSTKIVVAVGSGIHPRQALRKGSEPKWCEGRSRCLGQTTEGGGL